MFPAFSRIWVINILLAAFVVFFAMMSFDVWSKGDETIPEIQTGKNPEKPLPGKGIIERKMPPDSIYSIVAEKNLFSSDRSEVVPEKPTQKSGPLKISEKMVFLYGVVVMGDRKKALISNPESGSEANKKSGAKEKWVALGDTLGNFNVADIQKDRIILADGANKHEILLYDKNKPARKITAPEKAAPSTTASNIAGSGPTAPAAAAATTAATKAGTGPSPSNVAEGKGAPAAEYKIVNTPFGPVKRKIQ
jgi:hypothetical protein